MANEILNATLVTNGGRLSEVLASMLHEQLYDKTSLRGLMVRVPFAPMDSATTSLVKDAVPGAAVAAASETSGGASNAAYTTSEVQFTVARYLRQYQPSDLFALTASGGPGSIDPAHVVEQLVKGVELTLTDMLCALFPSLSNSVGTTLTNLSVSDIYSAMYQLILSNVGQDTLPDTVACVLHGQQIIDFMESLRNEPGANALVKDTADMLRFQGPGWKGNWKGVQFYQSDSVTAAGGNRRGAMFDSKCFGYQMGDVTGLLSGLQIDSSSVLAKTPELFVERKRDSDNGLTTYILNFYPAVSEIEDARGVLIATDD